MRARDIGLACGRLTPGVRNLITDVPGVRVGHVTLVEGDLRWFGLAGLVPILTGLFRFCPLYTLLGIRTCRA